MTLTLSVLRCPDAVPPETRHVRGGEFSIGRGPENDWTLPDPDRHLSKKHCVLAFRAGHWQLADTSTNGTFLNRDTDPVGVGNPRDLRDGDRLRVGAYEIEIRIEEDAAQQSTAFPAAGYGGSQGSQSDGMSSGGLGGFSDAPQGGFGSHPRVHDDPFGDDPFKPPAPPRGNPFHDDPMEQNSFGLGNAPVALPHDFDLLGGGDLGMPGGAPTQSDHTAAFSDAFQPPRPLPSGIPDDWDLDLTPRPAADPFASSPAPPPAYAPPPAPPAYVPPPAPPAYVAPPSPPAYAAPPQAAPAPIEPVAFAPPPQVIPPPPAPPQPAPPVIPDPFAEFTPPAGPVFPPITPPAPAAIPGIPDDFGASPFDEPELARPTTTPPPVVPMPVAVASNAPVPPPTAPAAADGALMAAFLHGADMDGTEVGDQLAKMTALGAAFRAMVGGLRQVLIARAAIKGEFRIEQTMIRARGNNPLKFSTGDDDALAALLGTGRRSEMAPQAAVTDALTDIRLHELATMAAMQSAVRALLARFDPASLRTASTAQGGITLPGQAKSRAWDEFERQHAATTQALTDDFDSVFGKVFARAYEQALDDVTAKEKRS